VKEPELFNLELRALAEVRREVNALCSAFTPYGT
jgi:hypothetical protein